MIKDKIIKINKILLKWKNLIQIIQAFNKDKYSNAYQALDIIDAYVTNNEESNISNI